MIAAHNVIGDTEGSPAQSLHWNPNGHFDRGTIRLRYSLVRTTPTPIALRSRSGYFFRAFSACSLDLNGLDSGLQFGAPIIVRPEFVTGGHGAVKASDHPIVSTCGLK